jgi:hypothetical protein
MGDFREQHFPSPSGSVDFRARDYGGLSKFIGEEIQEMWWEGDVVSLQGGNTMLMEPNQSRLRTCCENGR